MIADVGKMWVIPQETFRKNGKKNHYAIYDHVAHEKQLLLHVYQQPKNSLIFVSLSLANFRRGGGGCTKGNNGLTFNAKKNWKFFKLLIGVR